MQHYLPAAQHSAVQCIHSNILNFGQILSIAEQNWCFVQRSPEIIEPHVIVHATNEMVWSDRQERRFDFQLNQLGLGLFLECGEFLKIDLKMHIICSMDN